MNYEFECTKCDYVEELTASVAEFGKIKEKGKKCEKCKAPMKNRIFASGFMLKGGGWYSDGYGNTSRTIHDAVMAENDKHQRNFDKNIDV